MKLCENLLNKRLNNYPKNNYYFRKFIIKKKNFYSVLKVNTVLATKLTFSYEKELLYLK